MREGMGRLALLLLCWAAACEVQTPQPVSGGEVQARMEGRFAGKATGGFTVAHAKVEHMEQLHSQLCVMELAARFQFEGDLEGAFDARFHINHYGRCDAPAREWFVASGDYRGRALGARGTFGMLFVGNIDPARPKERNARGRLFVRRGTGTEALAGLNGGLTLEGAAGERGTYRGDLHFAQR